MTLVSGLRNIKKLKNKITVSFTLLAFVALLLFGADLTANETEKQHINSEATGKVPVNTAPAQKNKDSDKELTTFTPTEEVSADQAVAFPSDI